MSAEVQTPAETRLSKVEVLKNMMNSASVQEQFVNAWREHKDAFAAAMIELVARDSKLLECDPKALIREALKAALLKLPVDRSLGFAYIIPYNVSYQDEHGKWKKRLEPTFVPGYKGYIQLALRTREYRYINAGVVYEGEFRTVDKLTGVYDLNGNRTSDTVIGYFAYIQLLYGFEKTMYMTVAELHAYAAKNSKSYDPKEKNNIWVTNEQGMGIKTVLRYLLSHYGLLSAELSTVISRDLDVDHAYGKETQTDLIHQANSKPMAFDEAEIIDSNTRPGAVNVQQSEDAPNNKKESGKGRLTRPDPEIFDQEQAAPAEDERGF
ncbi:recombinase RecT [Dyadobacter sp. BHUBP1]|uniref:recombinase RecT n=1 Tax=Dyadobacter sp. BHUBP1 TaxID=3424178 RepID=UPI003D32AC18